MTEILIAIKNEADLKILKEILEKENIKINLWRPNISEYLKLENIDLIIFDIFFAKEYIEKIKEIKASQEFFLPIVCLIPREVKSEFLLNKGFDDVIRYPVSKSEFLSRIKNLLKIREQAKKISEKWKNIFKTIFETANDAIFIIKKDRFIECNLKTLEIFRCKKEEIIGETPYDKFSPPLQPDGRNSKEKAIEKIRLAYEGIPQFFEWRYRKLNGEEFDAEVSLNRFEIEGEYYLIAIVRDITERKKLEKILEENERKYRTIVEKSHAGILVVGDDYKFIYVNDKLCEIAGREKEEIIGHDFREFIAEEHKEFVANRYKRRQRGEEVPERYEFKIIRKDGSVRDVEIISSVIDSIEGKKITIAQILDITERKRAEEELKKYTQELEKLLEQRAKELVESERRYRLLVESPLVAFWETDADGNFEFVNERFLETTGYGSKEEIVRKQNIKNFIISEEKDWLSKITKEKQNIIETKFLKKDGSVIDVLISPAFIYDEKGKLLKIIGAIIDITERKKLEERLIEINKELESFAFTVSHDLRTPLRAMQGFANALFEDYGDKFDETAKFYIERIRRASENMDLLIRDLLEYSRISRIEIKLLKLNPEVIIKQVLDFLEKEIKEKNAKIEIIRPLPEIKSDKNLIFQIFLNLISNAIKFVEEGKVPEVKIWAEEKGELVRFWIEDNGIGIREEYHEKIFKIFERLHTSEKYPGTGVGLAIVKKCIERIGGKVGVISEEGKGSKFWFEILKGV